MKWILNFKLSTEPWLVFLFICISELVLIWDTFLSTYLHNPGVNICKQLSIHRYLKGINGHESHHTKDQNSMTDRDQQLNTHFMISLIVTLLHARTQLGQLVVT